MSERHDRLGLALLKDYHSVLDPAEVDEVLFTRSNGHVTAPQCTTRRPACGCIGDTPNSLEHQFDSRYDRSL